MSATYLMLSLLFSSLGLGYFVYGKRQSNMLFLGTGLALMVFPYLVTGAVPMILVGVALAATPFAVQLLA